MTDDNQEIEIKIKLKDAGALRRKVMDMGATIVHPRTFERDVMYDDGKGFFEAPKVLRLRQFEDGRALLTYKEPLPGEKHQHLLERTEIQVWVTDAQEMDKIIQKLGFFPYRIKEKYAEHVKLKGFELEFHTLPFIGDFLEIEAAEEKLEEFLPTLGFSLGDGINNDYTGLYETYCETVGIPMGVPQSFEEEKKYRSGGAVENRAQN